MGNSRKLKLIIVVPSLSKYWGGTTTSVMNYYYGLSSNYSNLEIQVVSTYYKNELDHISEDVRNSSNFVFFETNTKTWRYSRDFYNYIDREIPLNDIVWIHGLWVATSYSTASCARKNRKPYIVTPHGMLEPKALNNKKLKKYLYWSLIEKKILKNAFSIHCINDIENKNINNLGLSNTITVPNGIDIVGDIFPHRKRLGKVLYIGRLHPIKGIDNLILAIANIENIQLHIAGTGDKNFERYLKKIVEKYALEGRVVFEGFLNKVEKEKLMRESDFIAVPSHSEAMSMVILEALSNAVPLLVTKGCNFDDIDNYSAGLVLKDNEPDSLRNGIVKMMNSDLNIMSNNALQLAHEKYEIGVVCDKLVGMLSSIKE